MLNIFNKNFIGFIIRYIGLIHVKYHRASFQQLQYRRNR